MRIAIMTNLLDPYLYDRYLLQLARLSVVWNDAERADLVIRDPTADWRPPADFDRPVVELPAPIGWERLRALLREQGMETTDHLNPTPAFGELTQFFPMLLHDEVVALDAWLEELERRAIDDGATPAVREAVKQARQIGNALFARATELVKQNS